MRKITNRLQFFWGGRPLGWFTPAATCRRRRLPRRRRRRWSTRRRRGKCRCSALLLPCLILLHLLLLLGAGQDARGLRARHSAVGSKALPLRF